MDNILLSIFTWQMVLYSLGITGVVFVIRKIVDFIFHLEITGTEKPVWKLLFHIWDELLIQILPILVGTLGALLIKQFAYPTGIALIWSRLEFGVVAGLFSGFIYKLAKSFITSKFSALVNQAPGSDDENDLIEKVRSTINKE